MKSSSRPLSEIRVCSERQAETPYTHTLHTEGNTLHTDGNTDETPYTHTLHTDGNTLHTPETQMKHLTHTP